MTWTDEIIEEVRRVRNQHAAQFDYDISAICADIRRKQSESGRKIVSFSQTKTDEKDLGAMDTDSLKVA